MKVKFWIFYTLLVYIIVFLLGCTGSYIVPLKENSKTYSHRASKKEPLIRLLLIKGEHVYHIVTDSKFISVESKNSDMNSSENIIEKVVVSGYFDIKVWNNKAIIQNKEYLLPCKIMNLSKFKLNNINLYGNLILYNDFVVLEMPIERYLEGVVASEVRSNWPLEALKAQAVVSRTYAIYSIIHNFKKPYDLGISELHQKYKIMESIDCIKKAIYSTRGIIIYYHSEPIQAFYHSCSGGITESGGNVFSKDLPYLKSIRDPYSKECPDKTWKIELTSKDIIRNLKNVIPKNLKEEEEIIDIKIGARTSSGRVRFFVINFKKSFFKMRGNDFRLAMDSRKFKSLLITKIIKEHTNNGLYIYKFFGKGYGHGVGMSQWGAKNMAVQGFSFNSIIKFYYRGVNLGTYDKLPVFGG